MDNFFEILIYILIIVSFIASFFKKKPQQKRANPDQPGDTNMPGRNAIDPSASVNEAPKRDYDFDITKEIESFFNVGQPDTARKKSLSQPAYKIREEIQSHKEFIEVPEDSFHKTPRPEHPLPESMMKNREDYIRVPEESFHQTSPSEHALIDPWDKKQKEVVERNELFDSRIKKPAEKYEEYLEVRETAGTEIIRTIRNRLKDPSSLKEYIIISEIIGKPKALK